jgi:hypothetical protein
MPPEEGNVPDLELQGGCTCGRVRYRLTKAPITVNACHCRLCQRLSGSAFALNAMIEAEYLELTGEAEPELVYIPTDLSDRTRAWRCAACGVLLFNDHPLTHDHVRFIRVGTLDQGERLAPDAHYFVSRKHPWIALPHDVPAYESLPSGEEDGPQLPPEAQVRMAAALRA